jgi:cation:H+ antiporter
LSESPEKLSAFYWARKVSKAPMALANFVSSSINQWTVLVAMIPFIYSFTIGKPTGIILDGHQKVEILLTIVQSYLGFLFLASMDFGFFEAAALFALWLMQFLVPGIREEVTWVYGAWALVETVKFAMNLGKRNAFSVFLELLKRHLPDKR